MIIRRLLPLAFWAALLFTFVMATLPQPPRLSASDKVQHILAFATLAALAAAAYPRTPVMRLGILLAAFGALIEIVQTIPGLNRDGSAADWFADIAAAGFVLAIAALIRTRLPR